MSIIGFHYKRISAEKKKAVVGKINVNNNVIITKVVEAKINTGASKQTGIEFSFTYRSIYEPDVALMEIEGAAVYLVDSAKVKEILDAWAKDKKLQPVVLAAVYNYVIERCTVEALILSRDMGLPPHIPLPKVTTEAKSEKKK